MEEAKVAKNRANTRARDVAMVGVTVALYAISAWIVVPLGPIPFTMQMFAVPLAICVLSPRQAVASIYCYEIIGAVGVPVFSGMRGGFGVLLGPTGGFLLGYLIAVPLAALFLFLVMPRIQKMSGKMMAACSLAAFIVVGIIFTTVAYSLGCIQYAQLTGMSMAEAFAVSCVPFIVPDLVKVVLAAICAKAVRRGLGQESR